MSNTPKRPEQGPDIPLRSPNESPEELEVVQSGADAAVQSAPDQTASGRSVLSAEGPPESSRKVGSVAVRESLASSAARFMGWAGSFLHRHTPAYEPARLARERQATAAAQRREHLQRLGNDPRWTTGAFDTTRTPTASMAATSAANPGREPEVKRYAHEKDPSYYGSDYDRVTVEAYLEQLGVVLHLRKVRQEGDPDLRIEQAVLHELLNDMSGSDKEAARRMYVKSATAPGAQPHIAAVPLLRPARRQRRSSRLKGDELAKQVATNRRARDYKLAALACVAGACVIAIIWAGYNTIVGDDHNDHGAGPHPRPTVERTTGAPGTSLPPLGSGGFGPGGPNQGGGGPSAPPGASEPIRLEVYDPADPNGLGTLSGVALHVMQQQNIDPVGAVAYNQNLRAACDVLALHNFGIADCYDSSVNSVLYTLQPDTPIEVPANFKARLGQQVLQYQ